MPADATKLLIVCNCGQKMKVPSNAIGKTVSCVSCGERIKIIGDAPPPSEPEAITPTEGDPLGAGLPPQDDATDLLISHRLVEQKDLDDATMLQRDLPGTTWSLLMDMGRLDSDRFHELMAQQEGIANIELENYTVPDEVITIVPENIIRQHFIVPVDKLGKLLTLAMVCPHNTTVIQEVENLTGLRVKSMLCTYEAIRDTIKNKLPYSDVYAEDSMTTALAKEFEGLLNDKIIVRRVFRQPSLVPSSAETYQLQDAPPDDLLELAKAAANNPILLGRTLQMANSIAYGLQGKVTSFGQAAALLGPEGLAEAMQCDQPTDYKKQHKAFDIGGHLKRARFCAVAAHALATELELEQADTAYTTGLLFEVGRLILLEALPNSYAMMTRDEIGADLHEIESSLFQFPYTEAGYYALRKWNLPSAILEPVRFQMSPKQSNQESQLSNILYLSVIMTKAFINNEPLHIRTDEEDALHKLGTTTEKYESVFQTTCANFLQKQQVG